MQEEFSARGRVGLVEGVEPGNPADVDGLRVLAVDRDVECPGAAQYQVHILGEEAQFQLGALAGGGFLRMVGLGPGQPQRAEGERRGEMVDGWRVAGHLGRVEVLELLVANVGLGVHLAGRGLVRYADRSRYGPAGMSCLKKL